MSNSREPNELNELERITLRGESGEGSPPTLDAEAVVLREGWNAWGKLLDSANRDFDESACLNRLRASLESRPNALRASRFPNVSIRRWSILATVAASLFAALVVWRTVINTQATDTSAEHNLATQTDVPTLPSTSTTEYAWNDELDQRLDAMTDSLIYAGSEWRGYDAPYAALDQRLQDMTESLDDEPL
jgi:hypothetical protein